MVLTSNQSGEVSLTRARQIANGMFNPFRRKGGGELGQNTNGPLLQELAVGNSIHLNLIRDSQKRGGGLSITPDSQSIV